MDGLGIGIIGCGKMGGINAKHFNLHPEAKVVAAADISEEHARALAEAHNVPAYYLSATELLADPNVDAVVIAMPTAPRKDLALQAFAAGKHVLLEKPVAMNSDQVREMIAAKGNLIVGCLSMRWQHLKISRVAAKIIADGTLGPIRSIHLRGIISAKPMPAQLPPLWRLSGELNGGGILMNRGCYDLDHVFGLTGWTLQPRVVLGQTWSVPDVLSAQVPVGSTAETHVVALIRCAGGETIHLERAEYVAETSSSVIKIIGERGGLHLGSTFDRGVKTKCILDKADSQKGVVTEIVWHDEDPLSGRHTGAIDNFVRAIQHNRPCATSLENALVVQEVTDAIYASAQSGRAVSVKSVR